MTMQPHIKRIPLFPLNTVLFPGATIPLQIFESRYLTMIEDCLKTDSIFGIVLIKSGNEVGDKANPFSVGTTAKITSVKNMSNDRLYITAIGEEKFEILETFDNEPYMSADVEILPNLDIFDEAPKEEVIEAREIASKHLQSVLGLSGGWVENALNPTPSNPESLSYFIAQMLQLDPKDRQKLLEEPSSRERLKNCIKFLNDENDNMSLRLEIELIHKFRRQ
ncbi:MAG: LON peptidase substrate-binding domain-containing protein [SAR202 cluster bacterium]|nr:LON peptidase substrate-binding domain-containing protein [SAR202 cluster bacterium]